MAHTFTKNHLHVVFSTKERRRLIAQEMQERLWQYLTGICQNIDLVPVALGGMEDHVHMLFHLPPSRALADAMRVVKTNSSRWMNEHGGRFWLAGGIWSVQCEFVESGGGGEVHTQSEKTSSQDEF